MALTRKSLKAMGLTDEQVDSIVEMHTETVDGLKEKLKAAEEKAKAADDLQKELDGMKAKGGDDYKTRAEKAEKELKDYKAEIAAKETKPQRRKRHGPTSRPRTSPGATWRLHFGEQRTKSQESDMIPRRLENSSGFAGVVLSEI